MLFEVLLDDLGLGNALERKVLALWRAHHIYISELALPQLFEGRELFQLQARIVLLLALPLPLLFCNLLVLVDDCVDFTPDELLESLEVNFGNDALRFRNNGILDGGVF